MKNKFRKFGAFYITEAQPVAGDKMVCVQRKNMNYGLTSVATEAQIKNNIILDTVNWKVCITREQADFAKKLLADAKEVQKEFKRIKVQWSLEACLDSVIEKHKRVVFPRVKEYALSQIKE